jgi:hypothetical protein
VEQVLLSLSGNVSDIVLNGNLPNPIAITATGDFPDTFNVGFDLPNVAGADFRYTLADGTIGQPDPNCATPNISSGLVPISNISGSHIKILQCRSGWTQSPVVTAGPFNLRVASPTPSVPNLTIFEATPVGFTTATTGATWFCIQQM